MPLGAGYGPSKTARRLRDDLLLRLLLPMATILLVSGVLSYQLAMRFANRSHDNALLQDARSLSRIVAGAALDAPHALPWGALEMMLQADVGETAHFQVHSQRHGVIAGDAVIPLPAEEPVDEPVYYDGMARTQKLRLVATSLAGRGGDVLLVIVGETRTRRESLAGDIFAAVVFPQLALILFAVAVIVGGVASGLKPLEDLAAALASRRRDEFKPLPVTTVPGEARPLIEAFNGLLARLTQMLAVQQRFVADAAHQLRTPLAALNIQLEQALRDPDPARRQQLLQQLKGSVERTARLSGQLLLLARAEPGGAANEAEPVDLRALALEVGAQWVPRALQSGRDLGFSGADEPAWIVGDRALLGELIGNLIDNALRYGGPDVTLKILAPSGQAGPELQVEDDGPGIPAAELARVFERFHRVPGTAGDGSGLGLAIVREIAQTHGAEVIAEPAHGGGLKVRVRFPPRPPGRVHARQA